MVSRVRLNIPLTDCQRSASLGMTYLNILKDTKGEVKATKEHEYAQKQPREKIEFMLTANDYMIARLKGRAILILRKWESVDCLSAVTSTQHELQPVIEHVTWEINILLISQHWPWPWPQYQGSHLVISVNLLSYTYIHLMVVFWNGQSFGPYLMHLCTNRIFLKCKNSVTLKEPSSESSGTTLVPDDSLVWGSLRLTPITFD